MYYIFFSLKFYHDKMDIRHCLKVYTVMIIYIHHEMIITVKSEQWFSISIYNDHHNNFSYQLSPYKDITLLTIFPMLYISSLWLIYFVARSLYLLTSFTYFIHLSTSLFQQWPVCSLSITVCFVMFIWFVFKIPPLSEII